MNSLTGWHRGIAGGRLSWTVHRPPPDAETYSSIGASMGFTDEQWRDMIAVHEAGHVVVAKRVGLPVLRVEITPDGDGADQTGGAVTLGEFHEADWFEVAVMCAAGEQAALRWMHDTGLYTPLRGWANEHAAMLDRRSAVGFAATPLAVVTDDPWAWHDWRHLGDVAARWLDSAWSDVRALARALTLHATVVNP